MKSCLFTVLPKHFVFSDILIWNRSSGKSHSFFKMPFGNFSYLISSIVDIHCGSLKFRENKNKILFIRQIDTNLNNIRLWIWIWRVVYSQTKIPNQNFFVGINSLGNKESDHLDGEFQMKTIQKSVPKVKLSVSLFYHKCNTMTLQRKSGPSLTSLWFYNYKNCKKNSIFYWNNLDNAPNYLPSWVHYQKRRIILTAACLSRSRLMSASIFSRIANFTALWQISVKSAPENPLVTLAI